MCSTHRSTWDFSGICFCSQVVVKIGVSNACPSRSQNADSFYHLNLSAFGAVISVSRQGQILRIWFHPHVLICHGSQSSQLKRFDAWVVSSREGLISLLIPSSLNLLLRLVGLAGFWVCCGAADWPLASFRVPSVRRKRTSGCEFAGETGLVISPVLEIGDLEDSEGLTLVGLISSLLEGVVCISKMPCS